MDPGKLDKHEQCRNLKDCKSNKTLVPLWNPQNPGEPIGTHGSPDPAEPSEPSENAGTLSQMRLFAQCIRVTQSLLLQKNL